MVTEDMESILRKIEYDKFLDIKESNEKYKSLSFDAMNTFSIAEIGKRQVGLFNELLLFAFKNHKIDIFSVLIELIKNKIDPIKIKNLLNPDIKWIIANNISDHYNFNEDSTLGLFI